MITWFFPSNHNGSFLSLLRIWDSWICVACVTTSMLPIVFFFLPQRRGNWGIFWKLRKTRRKARKEEIWRRRRLNEDFERRRRLNWGFRAPKAPELRISPPTKKVNFILNSEGTYVEESRSQRLQFPQQFPQQHEKSVYSVYCTSRTSLPWKIRVATVINWVIHV